MHTGFRRRMICCAEQIGVLRSSAEERVAFDALVGG